MSEEPIWHAKDGRKISLSEMDDDHLLNARRFVARQIVALHENLLDLRVEVQRRGLDDKPVRPKIESEFKQRIAREIRKLKRYYDNFIRRGM